YELQIFLVRHRKYIHGKTGHLNLLLFEFVVPTETSGTTGLPQRCDSRRNGRLAASRRGPRVREGGSLRSFSFRWQIVQQVCESLGVHQSVLDRCLKKRSVFEIRIGGKLRT